MRELISQGEGKKTLISREGTISGGGRISRRKGVLISQKEVTETMVCEEGISSGGGPNQPEEGGVDQPEVG